MDTKIKPCPVCQTTEHPKAQSKGFLCKPCASNRANQWNRDNPDQLRNRHIKKTYGLSYEEYQEMFDKYDGTCWVCREPEIDKHAKTGAIKSLAVDHNHHTGKVRGLLCRRCNVSLGLLRDSTEILNNMITYMEKYDG